MTGLIYLDLLFITGARLHYYNEQYESSAITKNKLHSVARIEGENGTSIRKNELNYKIPLPLGNTDPIK